MLNAPIIKSPIWEKPFELICEDSDEAVGVVLGQLDGGNFSVIHHATRTLNEAQRNYPMAEKELFAVVFSCDKFRSYIIDSKVKVHMDRDGLKEILERTDVKPRMTRWILFLQDFELQIVQRKEEPSEKPKEVEEQVFNRNISTICIPPGTIILEKEDPLSLCKKLGGMVLKVKNSRKKEASPKLGEANSFIELY